jgi:CheY-like chemotaxis protein
MVSVMGMPIRNAKILVADDSADDAFFLSHAFRQAGLYHSLTFVPDGEQAIEQLQNQPRPDLLLLDLKMPVVSGFDVLEWLQSKPEFQALTVVVYSSSSLPQDRARARELGAKEYFVKSNDWQSFVVDLDTRFLRKG